MRARGFQAPALPICGQEKRRENRPKAYVARHERDGVAAKIAAAVSSYDFTFLPSAFTIYQNARRLHIFRILKQIAPSSFASTLSIFEKLSRKIYSRKTRLSVSCTGLSHFFYFFFFQISKDTFVV